MSNVTIWRRVRRTALIGILGLLTVLSGWVNVRLQGDVYPYASVDRTVGLEALERSQGVTTDGEAWIYSGKTSLVRVDFDNETILALNKKAIPAAFAKNFGSKHIGGISYYDGFIYAAIEDSKVWQHPVVALYDAQTLEFTGKYVALPGKDSGSDLALTHGVPWVACDAEAGVFYVAQCSHARALYAYDLTTFEYKQTIELRTSVDEIQGGEMYGGFLYVATNDEARAVYRINTYTGEVEHYFDRILSQSSRIANYGGEGEDITILPRDDGTLLHALNIGALFIDANLRHYAPVPGKDLEAKPDDPTQPAVTYLQKYVIDILQSNSYTFHSEAGEGRETIPLTCRRSGDKMVYEMTLNDLIAHEVAEEYPLLSSLGSGAKIRLILQGIGSAEGKLFLELPIGYIDASELSQGDMESDLEVMMRSDILQLGMDSLTYVTSATSDAYVIETYRDEEGVLYTFYFTSRGLAVVETTDPDTGEVLSRVQVSLLAGVHDESVFSPKGKKLELEEIESLFG